VPCDVLEHPRTLDPAEIAKAVTAGYFGSTTKYADFGACADALLKVFGVVKLFPLPAGVALCGNGVLETRSEQCDDGNTVSGDGCSSLCTKEGRYFDCWVVGEPCKPNCSFPYIGTAQDLGLYGYYLTDPFCSKGPQALESRAPCGAECSQSRLGYGECSPQNRGCLQCTSAQYPDAATQECAACGSLCQNGFYASTCAALPSNYHADTNNQLTPAQRGCYPCRTISGSETGSVWVSPGTLWNVRKSCKRVCATGYYCPRYNTTDGTCSTDIDCVLCSTIKCQTGFHASPCTATRDTECVPCENKPENSIWVDSDTDCDFKCESHTRYIAELVLCDPCENPKTCTHEKFAPYPCSESASATVNTAQAKYCRRCPEPSTPGMVSL
jgi:cysteine-rich repeat protein